MTPEPATPLLTVITVCLNRADTIAVALESVLRQQTSTVAHENEQDIEHLVIDGVSTDGTLEIVRRYPGVRLVSEPDTGLYDAMNKGLGLARGRYVLLLNSDDALADGIVAAARSFMEAGIDAIGFGTDFRRTAADGTTEVIDSITTPDAIVLSVATATLGSPLLNAKILRRDFVRAVGAFDLRYRLASDVDLLLRLALANPSVAVLPVIGHHYLEHKGSLTINAGDSNGRRAAEECLTIAAAVLRRSDLSPSVRFLLRAWRGGKTLALAVRERRAGAGPMVWSRLFPVAPDVARFGVYLVRRKLTLLSACRLAAQMQAKTVRVDAK